MSTIVEILKNYTFPEDDWRSIENMKNYSDTDRELALKHYPEDERENIRRNLDKHLSEGVTPHIPNEDPSETERLINGFYDDSEVYTDDWGLSYRYVIGKTVSNIDGITGYFSRKTLHGGSPAIKYWDRGEADSIDVDISTNTPCILYIQTEDESEDIIQAWFVYNGGWVLLDDLSGYEGAFSIVEDKLNESKNHKQNFMNAMNESFKAKGVDNRRACRESVKQSLQELKIHDSRFINKTPGQAYKLIETLEGKVAGSIAGKTIGAAAGPVGSVAGGIVGGKLGDKITDLGESAITEGFESDVYNWLENHYGTTNWKSKFKQYVDRIKKSGYNTSNLDKELKSAIKKISKKTKVKPQVFINALNESCKKKLTEAVEQPYFRAFITNLGKYNEGELVGEWVEFPIDENEFKDVLNRIDIDAQYEEWFVTDYDCNLNGFDYTDLGEYPSYEALQEFGNLVDSITDVESVDNAFEATGDLKEAIEGLEEGTILYHPGIDTEKDLGIYVAEEAYGGVENIPSDIVEDCFDYSELGRELGFDDYWDMLDEDQQEELLAEGHDDYYTAAEYFCGDENASDQEVGETYVDMLGSLSSISDPEQYFDFEAFGNYVTDRSAVVFTSDGCVEFLR